MEQTVLYRKYRPQTFKEMKGQSHITDVLESAIKEKQIAHAYLFSGSRGTGKTSLARIFARSLDVSENDIYEMDAASYTGVDNIRELRDAISVLPLESPYKVYIIDEVHMLSKSAFNAFLKTLEEPPPHVVFILATTEKEKVPDTVLSRCQPFAFKKPSQELLQKTVADVAKKEGLTIDPDAADLIAFLSEGSFRDALGSLQKTISGLSGKKISREEAEQVLGAPSQALIHTVVDSIAERNLESALSAVKEANDQGLEAEVFAKLLLHRLRAILLLTHAPSQKKDLLEQFGEDTVSYIEGVSKKSTETITLDTLRTLLGATLTMRRVALPYLPLELALIECISE